MPLSASGDPQITSSRDGPMLVPLPDMVQFGTHGGDSLPTGGESVPTAGESAPCGGEQSETGGDSWPMLVPCTIGATTASTAAPGSRPGCGLDRCEWSCRLPSHDLHEMGRRRTRHDANQHRACALWRGVSTPPVEDSAPKLSDDRDRPWNDGRASQRPSPLTTGGRDRLRAHLPGGRRRGTSGGRGAAPPPAADAADASAGAAVAVWR